MFKTILLICLSALLGPVVSLAQSTNGLITGSITDATGAVVPNVAITVTDQGTGVTRKVSTDGGGHYIVTQLPPAVYTISVASKQFATERRTGVELQVNQNATLDFKLSVSGVNQVVEVTGAPPALDATSATIGTVIGHQQVVDLPLDGRQFTQLVLLTPGAAPVEGPQQASKTITLGAGGISPATNGQRPQQNNFTMDGVLNNSIYTNVWAISPPPDALQEFNVQSHITDAQFSITSGANINIVTRSGTRDFHGAAWEFIRNSALDAQTFPATKRLPYRQNQYGVFFSGPVLIPRTRMRETTWFAGYWEGFRAAQTNSYLAATLTPAMANGDFSAILGTAVIGTDSLGRPEYANEIYDPATSRPDPNNPSAVLRDPFPGNIVPAARINSAGALIAKTFYPGPNLSVPAGTLPNVAFSAPNATATDAAGIRVDHSFRTQDSVFFRYNRYDANYSTPNPLPGFIHDVINYAQSYAAGYTHLFGTNTIFNARYGYSNTNVGNYDQAAGAAFNAAIGFTLANPTRNGLSYGPQIRLSNGYSGVNQAVTLNGPQENSDYHADLSKVIGHHTLGAGFMYYHVHSLDDGWNYTVNFTQNATSQGALTGSTGYGPASLILGLPDNYSALLGDSSADQRVNWYGGYLQDQWQVTRKLSLTAGLRYDYVTPPTFTKIVSGLNVLTGQFNITGAVPPLYPNAVGPSGYFYPQYNGWEPRFGLAYQATNHTVVRAAFALLDDHNNTLVQENQDLRLSYPSAVQQSVTTLNRSLPTTFINQLPSAASYLSAATPYVSAGANAHNSIPYSMEYNVGVEQQLSNSLVLHLDYVGSVGRHQFIQASANTALTPGPGALAPRQPFPAYGPFPYDINEGKASYNSLQAQLKKSLSAGLFFMASYTWSKSLDEESSGQSGTISNFYNLKSDYGPSDFNRTHLFVFSTVYKLPFGTGASLLSKSNRFTQLLVGDWNVASIISLDSGAPFSVGAGGDVANVGGGSQRANKIGNPYGGPGFTQGRLSWINKAAFATPAQYTFGSEKRNDLVGPSFKNVDFSVFKDFLIKEPLKLQFRSEFFNVFNHTNYSTPSNNVQSSSLGVITGAVGSGRQIQFALKLLF